MDKVDQNMFGINHNICIDEW